MPPKKITEKTTENTTARRLWPMRRKTLFLTAIATMLGALIVGCAKDNGNGNNGNEDTAPGVSIRATTRLTETNLDGATLTLTLANATYSNPIGEATQFTLITVPEIMGLSVMGVSRTDANNAVLTLAFDGTDFDANATLAVNVAASAHSGTTALTTSTTVAITAVAGAACNPTDFPNDDDCDGTLNATDVDDDNNGLIEIRFLEDLDFVRYNLAGTSYDDEAADGGANDGSTMGAPSEATANCETRTGGTEAEPTFLCGYELARSLNFSDTAATANTSYRDADTNRMGWTAGHRLASNRRQQTQIRHDIGI